MLSKTILVTGAAGFVSSHVAQAFLARGDAIIELDNLNDYYLLGYNPTISVREGVTRFLEWYERAVLGRGEHV